MTLRLFLSSLTLPISGVVMLSILCFSSVMLYEYCDFYVYAGSKNNKTETRHDPIIKDPTLKAELVTEGLKHPTSMAFLGPQDILVLEKDNGTVRRITDGKLLKNPLLSVNVTKFKENGMLGIAIENDHQVGANNIIKSTENGSTIKYVFLSYTQYSGKEGNNECHYNNYCKEGTKPESSRLYRYQIDNNKLVNAKLLLDLPATQGSHLGGVIVVGPDNNIYVATGDGNSCGYGKCDKGINNTRLNSQSANVRTGIPPTGRGGILRITEEGEVVGQGILGKKYPLNLYYAYGIRNIFGLDFDPVSGKLWDTENGPAFGDEINLVESGFNSGWLKIQGMWSISNNTLLLSQGLVPPYKGYMTGDSDGFDSSSHAYEKNLVNFHGKGRYSDPEFVWNITVAPTALKFLNSDKLGKQYENDLFVGDMNRGRIYHFDLNKNRTALVLNGSLADKVAGSSDNKALKGIVFGQKFSGISDS